MVNIAYINYKDIQKDIKRALRAENPTEFERGYAMGIEHVLTSLDEQIFREEILDLRKINFPTNNEHYGRRKQNKRI